MRMLCAKNYTDYKVGKGGAALNSPRGAYSLRLMVRRLDVHQLCDISHLPLLGRPCLLFPDGSAFLISSLVEEMAFVADPQDHKRLVNLYHEYLAALSSSDTIGTGTKVYAELAHVLGNEQPFYSRRYIDSLCLPFPAAAGEKDSWRL